MMSALDRCSSGARIASGRPSTPARVASAPGARTPEVLGPAVGIAGVVERVDADDDGLGAETSAHAEREREEDRVAGRDVGRRDLALVVELPILRDFAVADQRGAAERREVDVELEMPRDAERPRDLARRPTSRVCT